MLDGRVFFFTAWLSVLAVGSVRERAGVHIWEDSYLDETNQLKRVSTSHYLPLPNRMVLDVTSQTVRSRFHVKRVTKSFPVYVRSDNASRILNPLGLEDIHIFEDSAGNASFLVEHTAGPGSSDRKPFVKEGVFLAGYYLWRLKLETSDSSTHDYSVERIEVDKEHPVDDGYMKQADFPIGPTPNITTRTSSKSVYTVELFMVTDYSFWKEWFESRYPLDDYNFRRELTVKDIKGYLALLASETNMLYMRISHPDFQISCRLVGVYISMALEDSPWTERPKEKLAGPKSGRRRVNAHDLLRHFEVWISAEKGFPQFDHAVGISAYDLYSYRTVNDVNYFTIGMSTVGQVCGPHKYSVCEYTGEIGQLIFTIVHELGHNLGAYHDGEGPLYGLINKCKASDYYIMSSMMGIVQESNYKNMYSFSSCTLDAFRRTLPFKTCLAHDNNDAKFSDWVNLAGQNPGTLYDLTTQCQLKHGKNSHPCKVQYGNHSTCHQIYCEVDQQGCVTETGMIPVRGTLCGDKRWCILGMCLYDDEAPLLAASEERFKAVAWPDVPNYRHVKYNCPNTPVYRTTIKTMDNIPNPGDCKPFCQSDSRCQAFSFIRSRKRCLLKNVKDCFHKVTNNNDVHMYLRDEPDFLTTTTIDPTRREGLSPTSRRPQLTTESPGISGFIRYNYDCESSPPLTFCPTCQFLMQCSSRCIASRNCDGFSWNPPKKTCILRGAPHCSFPGLPNGDAIFYRRQGETRCGKTNEGKEFWLAFMQNLAALQYNVPVELFVTTSVRDATVDVVVESPIDGVIRQTIDLRSAQKVVRVALNKEHKMIGTMKARKGIRVYSPSGKPLVVYGVNKDHYTSDAFLALPVDSIGQRYYAVTWYPPTNWCEICVVAAFDLTVVNFTLPEKNCAVSYLRRRYVDGQTISVSLDIGETFQLQAKCDLTGTYVSSSKPVSFFSGNARTTVGRGVFTRDHLVEQLPAIPNWGHEFAVPPIPRRTTGDYLQIISSEDGNDVKIENRTSSETIRLKRGEDIRRLIGSQFPTHVLSQKPILVLQTVHSQKSITDPEKADPSSIYNTPVEQYGYEYYFTTPAGVATTYRNYIMIIVEQDVQSRMMLNGRLMTFHGRWQPVPGTNLTTNYAIIDRGTHRIHHETDNVPFAAYIYGAGHAESYAFPTGLCLKTITCETTFPVAGDQRDNDCDGKIDEESCVGAGKGVDEDGDGRIDEDCRFEIITTTTLPPTVPPPGWCPATKSLVACDGTDARIFCSPTQRIKIIHAHYGRVGYDGERTCDRANPLDCSALPMDCGYEDVYETIAGLCNNRPQCNIFVGNTTFHFPIGLPQGCVFGSRYLDVEYFCFGHLEKCSVLSSAWPRDLTKRFKASSFAQTWTQPRLCEDSKSIRSRCDPKFASFHASNIDCWCPATCDNVLSFLEYDLGSFYRIKCIYLQGGRRWNSYVTKFGLGYSNDYATWTDVSDNNTLRTFMGNNGPRETRMCCLGGDEFVARYIRIYVLDYHIQPSVHFGVVRCPEALICPPLKLGANTIFPSTSGHPGVVYEARCKDGYVNSNGLSRFNIECGIDGRWNDTSRCALKRDCGEIPLVPNSMHSARNTKTGSKVSVTCDDLFEIKGLPIMLCQGNGKWTDAPSCVRQ